MASINDAFVNSLLADAAYADGLDDGLSGDVLKDALSERMTPQLADFISDNFSIISNIESSDSFGSGLDATVWKGNIGTLYEGKIYVSLQGTVGIQDMDADIDLTVNGAARDQIVDMINWWSRITTSLGEPARQIVYDYSQGEYQFILAPTLPGTGLLVGASNMGLRGFVWVDFRLFRQRRQECCDNF